MLNLDQVATYLTILRVGSFHEAARQLGVSQASVSQQLRKLEHTVGTQLVIRDRAGCRPRPQAGEFARYATALVDLADRATRSLTRPLVAVGAASNIGTYLLPPLHRRFLEHHGDTAELRPTIDHNQAIADLLDTDAVDVALMEWWDNRPGFTANIWRTEELVVIVGPAHPWRSRQSIRLAELAGQPLLGGEPFSGTGTILRQHLRQAEPLPTVTMNLGSTEAVKTAVRNGLGISLVLAGAIQDEAAHGGLHVLHIADVKLRKELHLAHRPSPLPGSAIAKFVEFALAQPRP